MARNSSGRPGLRPFKHKRWSAAIASSAEPPYKRGKIMRLKRFLIVTAAGMVALIGSAAMSLTEARTSPGRNADETVRAQHAASVLEEVMEAPDQGIPEALLKK